MPRSFHHLLRLGRPHRRIGDTVIDLKRGDGPGCSHPCKYPVNAGVSRGNVLMYAMQMSISAGLVFVMLRDV